MALPGVGPFATATTSGSEDPSQKIRKPYTITKSRESWTEPEHDKFLEALQLFDRDWKKIEAFVGSKTVIQIRSHAQKYFLKVQKSGTNEHLPPPRPKRKAAHPYPHKASKNVLSPIPGSLQSSSAPVEPRYIIRPDSSSMLVTSVSGPTVANNCCSSTESTPRALPLGETTDQGNNNHPMRGPTVANNCCRSTESTPRAPPLGETTDQGNNNHPIRVLPDFAQVYSFIGSIFDPNVTGHLQKLKEMDPIDVETVLLLMRNLSLNLISPGFEDHRRLLSSYEIDTAPTDNGAAEKAVYDGQPKSVA